MFKNRFIVVLGVLSLLLVTMAVSQPFSNAPASIAAGANDFYERHPNWNRNLEASDYYERHAELGAGIEVEAEMSDFSQRHPEWASNAQSIGVPVTNLSASPDYFQRHPELSAPIEAGIAVDRTDYFIRQRELRPATELIDLSDYFLRH